MTVLQPTSLRTSISTASPVLRFTQLTQSECRRDVAPLSPSDKRQQSSLAFLYAHPQVRMILLPGVLVRSTYHTRRVCPSKAAVPARNAATFHPTIGVFDVDRGTAHSAWVIDWWDFLTDEDADLEHGSFIGWIAVLTSPSRYAFPRRTDISGLGLYREVTQMCFPISRQDPDSRDFLSV